MSNIKILTLFFLLFIICFIFFILILPNILVLSSLLLKNGISILFTKILLFCLFLAFFIFYVFCATFSVPGAALLTLIAGFLFDFILGSIVVSFGSSVGATLAFLISRFLMKDFVQKKVSFPIADYQ